MGFGQRFKEKASRFPAVQPDIVGVAGALEAETT